MVNDTLGCLTQGETLLASLDDEQYRAEVQCFSASISTHMRHITDHYLQLLKGLDSGVANYDLRQRNNDQEILRTAMIELFADIRQRISRITDQPLVLHYQLGQPTGDGVMHQVASSVARELHFLYFHSVHHYAQIATQLVYREINVPQDFGVAPATLLNRRKSAS